MQNESVLPDLHRATHATLLDRLERRGLITRGPRPGDRRAVLLELTADGVHTAAVIRQALRDLEKRALAGLSEDAISSARAVLRALTELGR